MINLSVVKVNLFNSDSATVFSSDPTLIGIRLPENPGIIGALNGDVVSAIVRKNKFNSHDLVIETRDLIQTYIPFHDSAGVVVGVFEIYSDITPLLARISDTHLGIVSGVSGILVLFFALLVWLYGRTDQKLVREQVATRSYLGQIESANATLETRVAERTRMLEKSRNFLQTAIDGVPDPAIVIGTDYRITSMNKAARAAFAIDQNDGAPLYCYRTMHDLDAPCDDADYPCTLKNGVACKSTKNRKGSNGNDQQVEFRTTPLRGPDGELTGAIEVAHDLNEREQIAFKLRQAKERAETANRVKSEFVAAMSHEIRTPLNAVLGMTDLLRLTDLTRKQQGYIQTIQSSGDMLLSLVDNILDFSRLGAAALVTQKREFNVQELLERVLEIMGYHAYSRGLELVGVLDADLTLRVSGDRDRLRQILVNLARNAVKFSDEGEVVIRIGIESESDAMINLLFSVSDRGIGMSDEVKARLYTPFGNVGQQLEGQQGSGLGLTICKQLVEQMGGEISIDSKPGEGTRVRFTVPVERKAASVSDLAFDMPALRGRRLLAVHNSPVIDQAICAHAVACGMRCDIADSDEEAIDCLQTAARTDEPYAAAIIDSDVHDSSGLDLARQIRAADGISLLPIVLLAPISSPLEPGTISAIGRISCINKPILPSELLQSLLQLIDNGRPSVTDEGQTTEDTDLRILVAEDNPLNRQVLTGMLESLGYSADCVEDGPAALEALSERPYDIVLMDCQMPGMDGELVTRKIRDNAVNYNRRPVIVAITADASPEHRSKCLAAGMDDFIGKPIRLGELNSELERWKSMLVACEDDTGSTGQAPAGDHELLARLDHRTGSQDEPFLSNYVDLFLQDTEMRLQKMAEAMEDQDVTTMRRECHSLKGACLEFGMSRMDRYCDDLRHSVTSGSLDDVSGILSLLRREFERVRPVFEAEKARQANRLP
jgi:hypothetical protein